MINYTMDYCFGDLEATVVFCDGASDNPMASGIDILHVYVGTVDILDALTVAQLDDIAYYATDFVSAA